MAVKYPKAPVVTVDVTEEIIAASTRADSSHCMIAEAVRLACPDARHVSVDIQTIRFSDPTKGLRYTYLTPRVAQVALIAFDYGETPEPFRIRLVRGHVTAAGRRRDGSTHAARERTEAEQAAQAATGEKLKEMNQPPEAKFSVGPEALRGTGTGNIPDRVGGRTPPTTPHARRRQFGLRALERGASTNLRSGS